MYKLMDGEKKSGKEKTSTRHNQTGIPAQLKKRVEENTGFSLDDVRVHYGSDEPSKLDALAYTRGNQVYIGPGQERHLPHELGHVVQQKLGIVQPNERHYSGAYMNTDQSLETQADRIGEGQEIIGADPMRGFAEREPQHLDGDPAGWDSSRFLLLGHTAGTSEQAPVQRKVGLEFQTYTGEWNIKKLKKGISKEEFEERIERGETGRGISDMLITSKDRIRLHKSHKGFEMTIDGPDLEYITEAFDEQTHDGRKALRKAARAAGDMHKAIKSSKFKYAKKDIGNYYRVEAKGKIYYINKNGEQTAHPQATVGVEYERIPDLMNRIAEAGKESVLYQNVPTAHVSREQLNRSRGMVDEFLREGEKRENEDRCRAFLLLTQEYLMAASERHDKVINSLKDGVEIICGFRNAVEVKIKEVNAMEDFKSDQLYEDGLRQLCRYAKMFMGEAGEKEGHEILSKKAKILSKKAEFSSERAKILSQRAKISSRRDKILSRKAEMSSERDKILSQWAEIVRRRAEISKQRAEILEILIGGQQTEKSELTKEYNKLTKKYYKLYEKYNVLAEKDDKLTERYNEIDEKYNGYVEKENELAEKNMELVKRENELIDEFLENVKIFSENMNKFLKKVKNAASLHIKMLPESLKLKTIEDIIKGLYELRLQSSNPLADNKQLEMVKEGASICYTEITNMLKMVQKYCDNYEYLEDVEEIEAWYVAVKSFRLIGFEHYFKTLLSVKTRTSLFDLYSKLSEKDRTAVFQYLDEQGYPFIKEMRNAGPLHAISYKEWKEGMERGRDLANYELEEGNAKREHFKKIFGVKTSTDIGHVRPNASGKKENIDGALLELRKLRGKVPPEGWGDVAKEICEVIRAIHRPSAVTH